MESPSRLNKRSVIIIVGLCFLAIAPGLASRLSYHEAIVAQGVREMRLVGNWLVPLLDNRPWLEKPPLLHWLIHIPAAFTGEVTEVVARIPSFLGAIGLALAVATLGRQRFNPSIGLLAGCIQVTTSWTVLRGRLAEADMLLACLIAWTIVTFDRLRILEPSTKRLYLTRLLLLGIGATALLKGIAFGAVLIVSIIALIVVWDRNGKLLASLFEPVGLVSGIILAVAWPAIILARYPEVLNQWTSHVTDRLADRPEIFAGHASWWAYLPVVLSLTLPWTPFALWGAWRSFRRAWSEAGGVDRLLWAWAVAPLLLLSMATVKNPHYAIHALAPWSIWAALCLQRLGLRLQARGWAFICLQRRLTYLFLALALTFGIGFGIVAPRLDKRSVEWAFYDQITRYVTSDEPFVFIYDDWDRLPYPTPFGPMPHDLPVRLFYLRQPALWREGKDSWAALPNHSFLAIARERDEVALSHVGQVERLFQGPSVRWDRTYVLYRITPESTALNDLTLRR